MESGPPLYLGFVGLGPSPTVGTPTGSTRPTVPDSRVGRGRGRDVGSGLLRDNLVLRSPETVSVGTPSPVLGNGQRRRGLLQCYLLYGGPVGPRRLDLVLVYTSRPTRPGR